MKNILYAHSVSVIGGAERVSLSVIEGLSSEFQPVLLASAKGDLIKAANNRNIANLTLDCVQPELT